MPTVIIPRTPQPGALPASCLITGEEEGLEWVLQNLEAYDAPAPLLLLLVFAGAGTSKTEVSIALPFSARGREILGKVERGYRGLQVAVGSLLIGPPALAATFWTLGFTTPILWLLLAGWGLAVLLLIAQEFLLAQRPRLQRAYGGWLRLKIPSRQAAELIGNCGWPQTWAEAIRAINP